MPKGLEFGTELRRRNEAAREDLGYHGSGANSFGSGFLLPRSELRWCVLRANSWDSGFLISSFSGVAQVSVFLVVA